MSENKNPCFRRLMGRDCSLRSRSLQGRASNEKRLIRCAHSDFCFHPSFAQASLAQMSENKNPCFRRDVFRLAEKEGFEPPDPLTRTTVFKTAAIRPLCHFSAAKIIFFYFLELFLEKRCNYQIFNQCMYFYQHEMNKTGCKNCLTIKNNGRLRHFWQNDVFIQKICGFNLKVPLFVEKRKNKFAQNYKKNKFVFN